MLGWIARKYKSKPAPKIRYRFFYKGVATQLELFKMNKDAWVFYYKGNPIKTHVGEMVAASSVNEAKKSWQYPSNFG